MSQRGRPSRRTMASRAWLPAKPAIWQHHGRRRGKAVVPRRVLQREGLDGVELLEPGLGVLIVIASLLG
jgi:hypothetical protein